MQSFLKRTTLAGHLEEGMVGTTVTLNGWVSGRRDLGGLIFIDLRDHSGFAQVVFSPQHAPALLEDAAQLRDEFVISVSGEVRLRENPNDNVPTGAFEIYADSFDILNRSEVPPFDVMDRGRSSEELRLRHRYLELRNPELQRALRIRNQIYQTVHSYFAANQFVEVETPLLIRATPEGARDYVVPSRVHPGQFFALPQSPQIYKQILMIAGYDRYVQIAKCLRDEDLRADRQPEFTQIDLEMAFVEQEDVLSIAEGFVRQLWQDVLEIEIPVSFDRITYREAMTTYGSDKPDRRFGMELISCNDIFPGTDFVPFAKTLESHGSIVGVVLKGGATAYSRKVIDELTEFVKRYGAGGLAWTKMAQDGFTGGIGGKLSEEEKKRLTERFNAEEGDIIFIISDTWRVAHTAAGELRLELARREDLIPHSSYDFLFVVDFPMFEELHPITGKPVPAHHPFTSYRSEDAHLLDEKPMDVRANAYDLVINGYEAAGGSIRIHDTDVQMRVLDLIGLTPEEANEKFGFLLDALKYGAPPHGGIAFGLDRLAMILAGTTNIRDVIAFPKTTSATSLMDKAPSPIDPLQLKELGIEISGKKKRDSDESSAG